MTPSSSYKKGLEKEEHACAFLKQKGYDILKQRYKTPYGEIDILDQKNKTLLALEVKFRKSQENALYSIKDSQKKRISQALLFFLQESEITFDKIRFDVMLF